MSDDSMVEVLQMLDDCEQRESRLNEWERGFVESVRDRLEKSGKSLTPAQAVTLDAIWEMVTAKG